jgi:alpha-L-rhamnosidase
LLHNVTFPSWGFSIKHGATSIWERWDGWTPEHGFQDPGMNSFAHYSFGAVYQWMVENIGGIHAVGPGYRQLVIAPRPGGKLTSATVGYRSIRGQVDSSWMLDDKQFVLDVTIPANTTAQVVLPASGTGKITESGQPLESVTDVKLVSRDADRVTLAVGSGKYRFVVR